MSFNIPYTTKVNEQPSTPVSNEAHIIGLVGTATYASGLIRLTQVPQGPAPAVTIPGYTEIISGTPTGTQFLVNYTTGSVAFDPSLNGTSILVTAYNGLGSEIAAEDVNELQNPVSTIATQNIVYNWPLAPTVSWSLASSIVLDANISPLASISLSKLQPLAASIVPVTNASGILTSSATTATELGYVHGVTSPIQTQINNISVSAITALTGDVSATGPGSVSSTVNSVGGSTASNIHSAVVAVTAATNLDTPSTLVKRDGTGSFSAGTITLANQGAITFNDTELTPKSVILNAPTTLTSTYNLVLPLTQGSANTYLQNDGFGNLSWNPATAIPGGASGSVQYNNSGALGGASILSISGSSLICNNGEIDLYNTTYSTNGTRLLGYNDGTTVALAIQPINASGTEVYIGTNGSYSFSAVAMAAPVLINSGVSLTTVTSTLNSSAILQVDSTTQGFLPPRMTTAQMNAIVSPTPGLMVYATDVNQWYGWNNLAWVTLG